MNPFIVDRPAVMSCVFNAQDLDMERERLHYLDILKGMAIFLVVCGHVITMCIREIDRAAIFKFIGEIHMPLFFFISGWFTMKLREDGSLKRPDFGKRALQLIVPMVAVSTLWIYYFPHSGLQSPLDSTWHGLWLSVWKNGYWFTGVLFTIMVIYGLLTPVFSAIRNGWTFLLTGFVVGLLMYFVSQNIPVEVSGFLGLSLVACFFPVFAAGVAARRHRGEFEAITVSGTWVTIALIFGGCLMYFICWPWEFPMLYDSHGYSLMLARPLLHICLVIVAVAVVRPWSEKVCSESASWFGHASSSFWMLLGRRSLSIYLLHYFFLFPMAALRGPLVEMGLGFTPLFAVSAAVSLGIIGIVLGLDAIIGKSPLLAFLLTGQPMKTKKLIYEKPGAQV